MKSKCCSKYVKKGKVCKGCPLLRVLSKKELKKRVKKAKRSKKAA